MTTMTQTNHASSVAEFFDDLESNIVECQKAAEVAKVSEKKGNKIQQIRECWDKDGNPITSRQGDIYIRPLKSTEGLDLSTPEVSRQLAPGNSIGASHVVQDSPHVKLFKFKGQVPKGMAPIQMGPIIEASTEFTIFHGKHAFMKYPAGTYHVTYQLDWMTKQRALD